MPTTKASDLRKQTDDQLLQTVKENEKQLFSLRFQSATDRLETPSEMRKVRKDIARIKTILRQRDLEKLKAKPEAELKTLLESAEKGEKAPGVPFLGKRKPRREVKRLSRLLDTKPTTAAKGK